MKFVDVFDDIQLSDGQLKLVAQLEDFFKDDRACCFLMKGYAGTGKTFMLNGVVSWLKSKGRDCRVFAPTGRAAKVASLRLKGLDCSASTIHTAVYSSSNLKEYKIEEEDGSETFKFFFGLSRNQDVTNAVYIVDEASMLSNVYAEGEFFRFGSGCLLDDLIEYIQLKNPAMNRKLIFVGDDAQLPPVGMSLSPALSGNYIRERFGLSTAEYELPDVVRQNKDSVVLMNASRLRKSLTDRNFNYLKIEERGEVCALGGADIAQRYFKLCGGASRYAEKEG